MRPEIKVLAVSNVYSRLMHFVKKGDQEMGHSHYYDHGTLLASGKLLVEKMNEEGEIIFSKEFTAPTFIMVEKEYAHRLTALEDNTVASCIHALREIDETIVSSEFLVRETEFADSMDQHIEGVRTGIARPFTDRGLIPRPF
jgi:hypothetical protein